MVNEVPEAVKASDFHPLLPRAVGGVEADMVITIGAHQIGGMVVSG
jgi:hypothetical protein